MGFPDCSVGKESACNAGDTSSIPGSGRSPGVGIGYPLQYSWTSLVAQLVKNPPPMQKTWVQSLVGKIPWRRERLPTLVFCPRESYRFYSPWGIKEWDTTERLWFLVFLPEKSPPCGWLLNLYLHPGLLPEFHTVPCHPGAYIPVGDESKSESCSVVSNSLRFCGLYSPWNPPGQNTGVGSLSLLQRIFPTQESNRGPLHCRQILYQLSHEGSPHKMRK